MSRRTPFTMPAIRHYIVCSLLLLSQLPTFGQAPPSASALVQSFDAYRRQALQEKLFVHTDQTFYVTGETMWFKVYYVDGTQHKPLDVSRITYLELLDKDNKSVLQTKVALSSEGGNGTLFLPASLNSGTYLMRAYTSWMKNFSPAFFFEKTLTLVNPFKPLGLPLLKPTPDYDVQLFPEGGNLVQGLPGKVAFKVVDAAGRGVPVRGWLLTSQNDTLARFASHKYGMGRFSFTPAANTSYRVTVTDEKGHLVTRPLPTIYAQGYTMRLEESADNQLRVTVNTNLDRTGPVYLFAHTRNEIKAAELRPLQRETTFLVDKKTLGEGISHLTIFNADRKPVCERLYFKRPANPLTIDLKPDQNQYAPRTKVTLDTKVQASASTASQANLSVSVYRLDSLANGGSNNILSYLWMTSDLQGQIESPDYYLQPETAEVKEATDNLMLTHGWRRFKWEEVLSSPATKPFIPEHNGMLIQGTVTDPVSGAPVPGVMTYLSSPGRPLRLYVSRSDAEGRVRFEMQDFYGGRNIIFQTNPQDSLLKLTVVNPFAGSSTSTRLPEPAVAESQADQLLNRSVSMQVQTTYLGDQAIRYQYPPVDSSAFYGKPGESYLLDVYTRFPRMEEVLREYVLGVMPRKKQGHFRLYVPNAPYRALFEDPSLVLMDGVPIFDMDKVIEFSPLKIKQIDVITNHYFIGPAMFPGLISFISYKGDLAGFPINPAAVTLSYDGLQLQREFYSPRYETAKQLSSRLPDARTLLYWNPALKTDAQGKGRVQFYTSDQPGTYVAEVNGLDPNGQAGNQRVLFEVKNTPK
ncbi:carboxypeptidase-like regulatory domain-containing protein [Spirosoma aerophilum]